MMARRSPLAALFTAFVAAALGCSSETTGSSTTGADAGPTRVALDATMSVVSPIDGACFPLPPSPDATIPITLVFKKADLTPANVYLRPAGACSSIINYICGHIVVKVSTDGDEAASGEVEQINNQGATSTVNVLLRKFSNPYQDFKVEVALVDDQGGELLVAKPNEAGTADLDAGVPLKTSLEVKVRASCGGGDAGTDGG